jgi:hypothetical protein
LIEKLKADDDERLEVDDDGVVDEEEKEEVRMFDAKKKNID